MNVCPPDPGRLCTSYTHGSWEAGLGSGVFILIRQQEGMTRAEKAPETVSHATQVKEPSIVCWRKRRAGEVGTPELLLKVADGCCVGHGFGLICVAPEYGTKIKGWKLWGQRIQPFYKEDL